MVLLSNRFENMLGETRSFQVILWVFSWTFANALNNGLVLTPPMGWLAWERFRCIIDCKNDPDNCISEKLFMEMAKRLASDGFKEAGYNHIIIDDCWMTAERDATGKLQPDPERFPHGIKYLADYVHSLGLKLGIYQDIGTKTCIGYPGSQGYEKIDVDTFAEWEIDYFKLDGCFKDPKEFDQAYPMVGEFIRQTGRKMVYSCSWPAYQVERKMSINWTAIREHCNLWRNYGDIQDSYDSITDIIQWYATNQDVLTAIAGPGAWNDPDMLIIGNHGLSLGQSQSQMAIWAILAAPLMMSNDLRLLRPEFQDILLNREIIAVDQDALGIQGRQILSAMQGQGIEVWRRPLLPVAQIGNETWASFAIVCWNRRVDGTAFTFSRSLSFYGLTHPSGYYVKELFTKQEFGLLKGDDILNWRINPSGSVVMWKATLAAAITDPESHKKKESELLRERLKSTDRITQYDKAFRAEEAVLGPMGKTAISGLPVFLQLIAVIVVFLIVLRIVGLRFGVSTVIRLARRILFIIKSSSFSDFYLGKSTSSRNVNTHTV